MAIAAIEIEPSGRLLVRPAEGSAFYECIYREANGLRWDRRVKAFHAHESARWEHAELLRHIASTLRSAFDEQLCVTEATVWVGVAPELERQLRHVLELHSPSP